MRNACIPAVLAAAAVALACGGGKKDVRSPSSPQAESSADSATEELNIPKVDPTLCDTKDKRKAIFDLDRDGRPDVWKLYEKKDEGGTTREFITCKQVDADHDGKKDMVILFDESGAILSEEYDFDFDGHFDARMHFDKKTGRRYLVERDTMGYDGKPDLWEKYDKDELLESIRRDRNGDGKPDYWEQHRAGVLEKILYDEDFDGRVDKQDEVKAVAVPAPVVPAAPASAPAPAPASAPAAAPAATR